MDFRHATGLPFAGPQFVGDLESLRLDVPDVVVDFSTASAARNTLRFCAELGIAAVVGTTGLRELELAELAQRFESSRTGCIVAANFSLGAALMIYFAELAAPLFSTGEIIEMHHNAKKDAPSGTALATASRIDAALAAEDSMSFAPDPTAPESELRSRGLRSERGVQIHSVRMQGMVAHQEVILGTDGQTLSIRHDSFDRRSFMPGLLLAVRSVRSIVGLVQGIDALVIGQLRTVSR
jgi:4-hydroxy-tetrahydrodipicolinate reductase